MRGIIYFITLIGVILGEIFIEEKRDFIRDKRLNEVYAITF